MEKNDGEDVFLYSKCHDRQSHENYVIIIHSLLPGSIYGLWAIYQYLFKMSDRNIKYKITIA